MHSGGVIRIVLHNSTAGNPQTIDLGISHDLRYIWMRLSLSLAGDSTD